MVAFKDAISESGRKLSLMVSENQQKALESLLADIQGAQMSTRRKALYSLMFFLFLVALYWTGLALVESFLSLRENLTGKFKFMITDPSDIESLKLGHLERMSAAHNSQMYEVNKRLEALESKLDRMREGDVGGKLEEVLTHVKEGADANTYVRFLQRFQLLKIFV